MRFNLLGHVNNVVYVDYLQEARADLLRHHGGAEARLVGSPDEGLFVVRHEVHYVSPLVFRFRPVLIECWVTEVRAASFTVAYEIYDEDDDGGRTTYARAWTVLTPYVLTQERPRRLTGAERDALTASLEPAPSTAPEWGLSRRGEGEPFRLHVRFSDVDVYGHVNNVKYFEYLQESRIHFMRGLGREAGGPHIVVARTDVQYLAPIHFREQPYEIWSWVRSVGSTSLTIDSEICDGDTVLARARVVVVFFDPETQRSTEPPEPIRTALRQRLGEVTGPGS